MRSRPSSFLIAVGLIALVVLPAGAQDTSESGPKKMPAMIPQGKDSLARTITVPPERQGETFMAVIGCQTYAQASGELENPLCVRDTIKDMDLRRSVLDALEGVKFSPESW